MKDFKASLLGRGPSAQEGRKARGSDHDFRFRSIFLVLCCDLLDDKEPNSKMLGL